MPAPANVKTYLVLMLVNCYSRCIYQSKGYARQRGSEKIKYNEI
ncbi:hypothetical protein A675_00173 [Salmonella enterica subsp. enterica serovar Enteritidis str. 2009K1726]|nr:hypothetical protein A675_00173 [Salmonella enterica subsp. enterica serovar Enteritidis str. 2009K1726]EPJ08139.1 hypothetical protein A678_00090 [Salmonella enterica subsp. enterica serovar Enteritidis str. 2010K-0271]